MHLWHTALMLALAFALPRVAPAQHGGVTAGWLHASGNWIVPFEEGIGSATFHQPGPYVGGFYAAKDSGTYFRLDLGWEHQAWSQQFSGRLFAEEGSYETLLRSGLKTIRMELLRLIPQVAFAIGPKCRILVGPDLGILLHARTMEVATTKRTSDPPTPHGGVGVSYVPSDTTYTSARSLNSYQMAIRLGVERTIGDKWSIGAALSIGRSVYVQGYQRTDALWPKTFRLTVGRRLFGN